MIIFTEPTDGGELDTVGLALHDLDGVEIRDVPGVEVAAFAAVVLGCDDCEPAATATLVSALANDHVEVHPTASARRRGRSTKVVVRGLLVDSGPVMELEAGVEMTEA